MASPDRSSNRRIAAAVLDKTLDQPVRRGFSAAPCDCILASARWGKTYDCRAAATIVLLLYPRSSTLGNLRSARSKRSPSNDKSHSFESSSCIGPRPRTISVRVFYGWSRDKSHRLNNVWNLSFFPERL